MTPSNGKRYEYGLLRGPRYVRLIQFEDLDASKANPISINLVPYALENAPEYLALGYC